MSQTDRENLSVYFDLVAIEHWPPINVLRAKHNWFFVLPVFQNSHMQRFVELD